tara:strand:+ start:456 stop:830 length:375 start_codon:yes stop_codon:yes gene_type:complete
MIHPFHLIGYPYRLGATPEKHGAADCFSLAQAIVRWHGVEMPEAQRSWYRRLRNKDYSVFKEELDRWGTQISTPMMATVALCRSAYGLGLATYFEDGWISYVESEVKWSPVGALDPVALYCRTK